MLNMAHILQKFKSVRSTKDAIKDPNDMNRRRFEKRMLKERDKLLEEFLSARTEIKEQFNIEKKEIIANYDRRNKYLRRLLEQCDEDINILKLNLDAEREENFILKTRIIEFENTSTNQRESYSNKTFEEEDHDDDVTTSKDFKKNREVSSISGLKYSDRSTVRSIYKSSESSSSTFASLSSIASGSTLNNIHIHYNCREEFKRLLYELRNQKAEFNKKLEEEKIIMLEKIEDEKLQIERVVFKQLNLKLQKEIKKQEFLMTENSHLHLTLANKVSDVKNLESVDFHQSPLQNTWKESSSDSGADVEDNRSDEELYTPPFGSLTENIQFKNQQGTLTTYSVNKLLNEQKKRQIAEFHKQLIREKKKHVRVVENLNNQIVRLTEENQCLRRSTTTDDSMVYINDEINEFHAELSERLLVLEELLCEDPDAC